MSRHSVVQKDANGKFVRRFPSLTKAEEATGIPRQRIAEAATGTITHIKGYTFEFDSPKLKEKNKDFVKKPRTDTLCVYCNTSAIICPWKNRLSPVPGWKATESKRNEDGSKVRSYVVRNCPLYSEGDD